jgi:hypothetical protein
MINAGRITKKQLLKIERQVARELEIEAQTRVTHNRVHRSKKTYNRKVFKQLIFD